MDLVIYIFLYIIKSIGFFRMYVGMFNVFYNDSWVMVFWYVYILNDLWEVWNKGIFFYKMFVLMVKKKYIKLIFVVNVFNMC